MVASPTNSVEITVDADLGPRKRLSVFFRPLLLLPVVILLSLLGGSSLSDDSSWGSTVFLALALIVIFTGTYPTWLLTFIHGLQAFELKIGAYALLLRDEYPSLADRPFAQVLYPNIEGGARLKRFMPLVKWFLAIPHYVVLLLTGIAVFLLTVLAWFSILFTGRYPTSFLPFVVGWLKYYNRVVGYAFTLVTDQYPQFRLG